MLAAQSRASDRRIGVGGGTRMAGNRTAIHNRSGTGLSCREASAGRAARVENLPGEEPRGAARAPCRGPATPEAAAFDSNGAGASAGPRDSVDRSRTPAYRIANGRSAVPATVPRIALVVRK
jgi:hypothetical protein